MMNVYFSPTMPPDMGLGLKRLLDANAGFLVTSSDSSVTVSLTEAEPTSREAAAVAVTVAPASKVEVKPILADESEAKRARLDANANV
jgi:hypothetical protein